MTKGYKFCKTEEERLERRRASKRLYVQSHKTRRRDYQRKLRASDLRKGLVRSARKRAKRLGIPIEIKFDDFQLPEYCPILNIKLEPGKLKVQNQSPSLDRVIPELGYIKGNVRVISYAANRLKSDMSKETLQRLYDYVFKTE